MRILSLALKDLLQIIHDRKSLIFLVLMPIAFTTFFGFILGKMISDPRLPVGWINADEDGALGTDLFNKMSESDVIRLVPITENKTERAIDQVRDAKLAAVVLMPAGFTTKTMAGETTPIKVVVLPGSPAGTTASNSVKAAINHLLSAVTISKLSVEAFETEQSLANPGLRQAYIQQALKLASQAWAQPAFTIQEAGNDEIPDSNEVDNKGFLQSSPGMIVMCAILSLTTCSMVLFLERKEKTLERLSTTPIQRTEIIAGHILAVFLVVFFQEALLISLGQIFFGVDYMREPFGTLLMMVAMALWVASLGLLIGAVSKAAEHVILFSLVAMFLLSPLGGAWFPLEVAGETFSKIGHITPTAWAIDGFQNIVLRGLDSTHTLLPGGILLAFAVTFFLIAVWRFKIGS